MTNKEILIYEDKRPRFEVQYDFGETHLQCEVFEINSWYQDNTYDDKDLYLKAWIKWDGCSHFNFGDEDGYLHLCGKHYIDEMDKVLQAVWKLASEKIPKFNPEMT